MSAAEILARRSGRCALCHEPIVEGVHYIAPLPNRKWAHAQCATGYRRLIAEQEEDAA